MADTATPSVPAAETIIPAAKTSFADKVLNNLQSQPPSQPPPVAADPAAASPEIDAAAPPPAAAPLTLSQRVAELGFQGVESEEDAQSRLIEAFQQRDFQAKQLEQRAQQLEELIRLREMAAQQGVQPPAVPPTPAGQANGSKWWNPPQVNQDQVELYTGPDGNWKPETPLEVKQQVERYNAYRKQWLNKLTNDPEQALQPMLEDYFERKWQERQTALEAKTQEEAVVQKFLREADWMYQIDPVSKMPRQDGRGGFLISADGQRFGQYMEEASNLGIPTHAGQIQYAMKLRELEKLSTQVGQQTTTQQVQQTNEQKKRELLQRAMPGPSTGGTFPNPGEQQRSQNPRLSLGEKVLAAMQRNGDLTP
jgi:hypothetical protein